MDLKIPEEEKKILLNSIKDHFKQNLEQEIGDLKADLLLEFVLKEIGPAIYNRAILDAQTFLQEKLLDMEAILRHERESPR